MKTLLIGFALLVASTSFGADVGDSVPCVDLKTLTAEGTEAVRCITLREAEDQYVILDFFQTTCGACKADMPNIARLAKETEGKALLKYIAIDRNEAAVPPYMATYKDYIHFDVPLDSKRLASKAVGLEYTPTMFIVNSVNKIVYKHVGTLDDAEIKKIKKLVGAE